MKSVWTMIARTSLPGTCENVSELKTSVEAFATFEAARNRMREVVKELTFTKNAMFDGNGCLNNLENYIADCKEIEEEEDLAAEVDELASSVLEKVREHLRAAFLGENVVYPFPIAEYEDIMLRFVFDGSCFYMEGWGDGPINGIHPMIKTDIFDMREEKNYVLHIDDYWGDYMDGDCSAELYIDLQKAVWNG